jgi:hypothetical protein
MSKGDFQHWKDNMVKLSLPDEKQTSFNNASHLSSLAEWKELVSKTATEHLEHVHSFIDHTVAQIPDGSRTDPPLDEMTAKFAFYCKASLKKVSKPSRAELLMRELDKL